MNCPCNSVHVLSTDDAVERRMERPAQVGGGFLKTRAGDCLVEFFDATPVCNVDELEISARLDRLVKRGVKMTRILL